MFIFHSIIESMLTFEGLKQASFLKNLLLGHYIVGTGICIKNIKKLGKHMWKWVSLVEITNLMQ